MTLPITERFVPRTAGGIATLFITLVLLTPLCGFLFRCGCTWPWAGFDSACNIREPSAPYHCPWCASMLAGWLSAIVSILAGVTAAIIPWPAECKNKTTESLLRLLAGIVLFGLTAVAAAAISASSQNYPLGILSYFHQTRPTGVNEDRESVDSVRNNRSE